ncbi:MAG: DNA helicase UvrD, partial [Candidatus Pacebacteria bacterium]|nr:DNA helicase UvrD [Candidatus Paceibacterota bacterium]
LNGVTLISNSDAHSFEKLGREANMLDCELSYDAIKKCFLTRDGFVKTIEFYPEEGKYHYDGHRDCDVCLHPKESRKNDNICPVCKKKLTVGVLSRVMDLSNQDENDFQGKVPYINLIPLKEIIANHFSCGVNTKKVKKVYDDLISRYENEFNILLNLKEEDCVGDEHYDICCDIVKAREGKVEKRSGYDGVFGVIKVNK